MHLNHEEQGTMYVVSLTAESLRNLTRHLDGAGTARLAIEVAPDAVPTSEWTPPMFMGDLKVSADGGTWTLPIAQVGIREAAMFSPVT